MTPTEALDTLKGKAFDAFRNYAATLDETDPATFGKLQAYAEELADWLERSMAPIIEAAKPRVLN